MNKIVRFFGFSIVVSLLLPTAPLLHATERAEWHFLVPPVGHYDEKAEYLKGYKILMNKPLSQWTLQGTYDSAAECETVRSTHTRLAQRFYSKSGEDYIKAVSAKIELPVLEIMRARAEGDNANVHAKLASQCIRSSDPKLM